MSYIGLVSIVVAGAPGEEEVDEREDHEHRQSVVTGHMNEMKRARLRIASQPICGWVVNG